MKIFLILASSFCDVYSIQHHLEKCLLRKNFKMISKNTFFRDRCYLYRCSINWKIFGSDKSFAIR